MDEYKIQISGSAPSLYPADTYYGFLWYSESEALKIPKRYPYKGEWGSCLSNSILLRDYYPMPRKLNLAWLSVVEKRFYAIEQMFPKKGMEQVWNQYRDAEGNPLFTHIIVGMAPYGHVALWFHGPKKSYLVGLLYAEEVEVDMADFAPAYPGMTVEELCDSYINEDAEVKENLTLNGLPPENLYEKYMQQFSYRYVPQFESWDEEEGVWTPIDEEKEKLPELDYVEEKLCDGTHDLLRDGGLLKYHQAGKPRKLCVKWHIGKSNYSAYFWFDDEATRDIFDRFYGAHRDTKVDVLVRMDPGKKKYQVALFRYGLAEPVPFSDEAVQVLVFKNKFEHYRSPNFTQPRGAWTWDVG